MTSNRKQLHLEAESGDTLDVVVTNGASMTYDGTNSMTFTAPAFKFRQLGQTQDTDLFAKFAAVEQTVTQNLGSNNAAITQLNTNLATAEADLATAEADLTTKNTEAQNKIDANDQRIASEETNRQTALSDLDNKFSKDFAGSGDDPAGLLHTLNAEMVTERNRIDQETKESETVSEQGDRQTAINDAKSNADAAILVQKGRVDVVAQQLVNLFANIPSDRLRNLANLITDYKAADSSLTDTLSHSRVTLDRLRGIVDTTFPVVQYDAFFFVPGLTPVLGADGKQYVDVRMRFDLEAPERWIVISSDNILASVHETSTYFTSTSDVRYQQPTWRITYQGSGLGYDIVCTDHADGTDASLSRCYSTTADHPYNALSGNRYFDIESVVDSDTVYYRILSKQVNSDRILTYTNGWIGDSGGTDHPTGDDSVDPCLFDDVRTGTSAKEQYIRFFSATSPYGVYE